MNRYNRTVSKIRKKIEIYQQEDKSVFLTSSFQTQSVPLLHIISAVNNSIPIYFIDTAFLFPETYSFKDRLEKELKLNIKHIKSPIPHNEQLNSDGLFHYTSNPDHCCFLNKVLPLDIILREKDVWINGVRRDQTISRTKMLEEEPHKFGCLVFRPMLDWTTKDISKYIDDHNLPKHPLENSGYSSIGCVPCTNNRIGSGKRDGRWDGQNKTECGIHLK